MDDGAMEKGGEVVLTRWYHTLRYYSYVPAALYEACT